MAESGALTLVPAFVAIAAAVVSRRPIESLLAGVVAGLVMLSPTAAPAAFSHTLLDVMMDETVAWILIVCGLIGSLIVVLMRSGAASAFTSTLARRVTTRRGALLATWCMGLCVFIDDYLNALTVGSSMQPVTDRHGISREMLAYIVDSTAAPVCMLIPLSTWAVFFSGLLEQTGVAPNGGGFELFVRAIPYMLYPWAALVLTFLVAGGWFPTIGPMRRAEQHPPVPLQSKPTQPEYSEPATSNLGARLYHFVGPLGALIVVSWLYDLDVQVGVILSLALTIALFGAQRLMPWRDLFEAVLDGIKIMVPALVIIVMAFTFKTVNDQIGMPGYVIETVSPWMTPQLVPVLTFITLALISFTTSSSWGVFVIAVPVVMPIGAAAGADTIVMVGAVTSASAFGSHACFYSDATVLAAQGSGCNTVSHALTQFPYALIAAGVAAFGFVLLA